MKTFAVAVAYDFKGTSYQLPGIRNDLGNFLEYCRLLGVAQSDITLFTDITSIPAVTGYTKPYSMKRNFYPDFFKTLNSLPANSRIVIYVSSHGTQVYDSNHSEDDNLDEAMIVRQGSTVSYIDDDTLSNLLVRSLKSSQEVLFLVDTCNSGTMLDLKTTYSDGIAGSNTELERTSVYNAIAKKIGISETMPANQATIVLIAAAKDFEYASATKNGSVFTIAFLNYFTGSTIFNNGAQNTVLQAQANTTASFIQLTETIEKYKIKVGVSLTQMKNYNQNCVISCNKTDITSLYAWAFVKRSGAGPLIKTLANSECSIL